MIYTLWLSAWFTTSYNKVECKMAVIIAKWSRQRAAFDIDYLYFSSFNNLPNKHCYMLMVAIDCGQCTLCCILP